MTVTDSARSTDSWIPGDDHLLLRNGEWYETGEWLEVESPWDGNTVGRIAWAPISEVSDAIGFAAAAMKDPLAPFERAEILEAAARILGERAERVAQTITAEAGKPITLARLEVDRAITTIATSADVARDLTGEVVPIDGVAAGAGRMAMTLRVPIGVVGAITPFNFPLNLSAHKLAPAIAAGCAVVHKPADKTPLTAVELARVFQDAGLPDGWLNLVLADPAATSEALLNAPEVGLVTFTGSAAVGWSIARAAERTRVALELGNATPVIVTPSARFEKAAADVTASAFGFSGQACVSAQRVLVDRKAREFVPMLVENAKRCLAGDPSDARTVTGPVIDAASRDRIIDSIERAVAAGATLECGGEVLEGNVIAPTVLTGVSPDWPIACEEVFGPVLAVIEYEDLDQAFEIANATDLGLQASIYTESLSEARRAAMSLEFGSVIVNDPPTFRADPMPYGGVKASGNVKEGPAHAVRDMTEERLVVLGT